MVFVRVKTQKEIIAKLRAENAELKKTIKQIKHSTKCPYCASLISIKNGVRHTDKGVVQRYNCLNCNRKFSIRYDTFRMRHDSDLINLARRLHKKGYSLREIQKQIKEVSHVTISRWIKDFEDIQL